MGTPNAMEKEIQQLAISGLVGYGLRVERAAQAVPTAVWEPIFTIDGGRIILVDIIGYRTVIQAGGADTMQLRHSVGPTVLDDGNLVTTGQAMGTIYQISADATIPIVAGVVPLIHGIGPTLAAGAGTVGNAGWLMPEGDIEYTCTAATGTGSIQWTIFYIPVNAAAMVVPV